MDLLNSEPVVSLSGDEFLPIEGKTFIQQVQEFFAAQGGKANSPFGTVLLDKKGIKNDLGHGIGRLKAASFAAVKDVLEKGVVINQMGQYHTNNKKNPTGMIAAPITIGGEKYVCVVEVIANRQVTRLYVHEVTLTKNLQGGVADSNAVPGDTNLVTQPQGEIAKVLRNYVNTKNNDENNSKTENRRHMNKKQIRLTESDLKQIVKESVNRILNEGYFGDFSGNYDDGFYECQKIFVLYKTLEEIRPTLESLNDMSEEGMFAGTLPSAIFHIKKGLEMLENDRLIKTRSRYFDNLQVSVDINGYKE